VQIALPFRSERLQLTFIERLTACIREQPIEHACEMLKMKGNRRDSSWPLPQPVFRETSHHRCYLFASLEQCMRDRLQQRRHIRQRSS
jgi:hypothetical protein